jgi:hypothetical protein
MSKSTLNIVFLLPQEIALSNPPESPERLRFRLVCNTAM